MTPLLTGILTEIGPAALAVSGGIDSLTLAAIAVPQSPESRVFHAVSPAVPRAATERVRQLAMQLGWPLTILDAKEFSNSNYRSNPINRCFYCKNNLYNALSKHSSLPILSGTNLDDLQDFRPGLKAASLKNVRHPFVEAGIGKDQIRELARKAGLGDLADLPASPCLSSRITTGLRIEPDQLNRIEKIEAALHAVYPGIDVRCRLRPEGYQIEFDAEELATICSSTLSSLAQPFLGPGDTLLPTIPYQRGSAFLTETG
ncbi:adenine nucleotide alpha hydrolase [Labrenzia sp. PHM005]|uniref:adenine nucleotide alpha hydrolase n=1 Tax=Labrenzia sp. PHM005 TaxID=2590016 RepID=UPI00114015FB|nr:adenine nucleotide alpha hydrolase [Labrenzia sp. PHM005]QDG75396.1 adenine nucleotide alpha hydrolase [Labrenzia sp. PHM005]